MLKNKHFNFLHNSHPTVSIYADGCELLASGAFLTSASVSKNEFFDTLKGTASQEAVPFLYAPCFPETRLSASAQPESMALRRSSGSSGRKVRAMAQFCRISSRLAQ